MEYISTSDEILVSLVRGFENLTINHNTSAMLRYRHSNLVLLLLLLYYIDLLHSRECLLYESLAKIVLFSEVFQDFFKYVESSHFDVAGRKGSRKFL